MTTTEGHDMPDKPEPLTGFELDNIEARWSKYLAFRGPASMETSAHDVPILLAEVDRLRAELKAAKAARFENNGVGDVAMHIQAETINDLRLN
jgi:hypothetical protein